MFERAIQYYAGKLGKLGKSLLIILPLNLLAGLIYCLLAKKMSVVSYSNVLAIIGGAYFAIGGAGFMGGMFSETDYNKNFSRDANQIREDNSSRSSFSAVVLTVGASTMLLSFAVLVFQ